MARLLPIYLDAVVSIEIETKPGEKKSIATGFLFGRKLDKPDPSGKPLYLIFLVTNRHVFEDTITHQYLERVFLRFNVTGAQTPRHYEVNLLDEKRDLPGFDMRASMRI